MQRYSAILTDRRDLSPTAIELTLQRPNGSAFPYFLPGQYATISFPKSLRLRSERSFSIASSPSDLTALRFGIRVGGPYTQELKNLQPGTKAMASLPFGKFTFDPSRDQNAFFLAGGIGITPFLSMIKFATAQRLPNDLTLLYSVRSMEDIPYRSELLAMERTNPHFHYAIVVTSGAVPKSDTFISGRITAELIDRALGEPVLNRSFFLCGPPPFMQGMFGALRTLGVPEHVVRTERFSAGSTNFFERKTAIPWFTLAAWGAATAAVFLVVSNTEHAKRAAVSVGTWLQTNAATTQPATTTSATPVDQTTAVTTPTVPANTASTSAVTNSTTATPTPVVKKPVVQAPVVQAPVVQQPVSQPQFQPRTRLS